MVVTKNLILRNMTAYPTIPTLRLYRDDSYAQEFSATIQHITVNGDEADIILNQTLFYAEAGGQPSDNGTLYHNNIAVAEVLHVHNTQKHGDTVVHRVKILESPLSLSLNTIITGKINWQRRYTHMQRHSAQHILSQSFLRSHARLATVSVNLQHAECTIDFVGEPSHKEIYRAFEIANRQGYAGAAIHTLTINDNELEAYPLRRPPQVQGAIRLVYVGDDAKNAWEMSACGGTHVTNVSEILPVHFLRSERVKGDRTRVYFICGWEALEDYRRKHAIAYGLSNDFSSKVEDVPTRVQTLRDELSNSKARINNLQNQLAASLFQQWQHEADTITLEQGHTRVVHLIVKELEDTNLFKHLGHLVSTSTGCILLLGAENHGRAQLLFTCSEDIAEDADIDLRAIFQASMQRVAGKGGGKRTLMQGAGTKVENLSEALALARQKLVAN